MGGPHDPTAPGAGAGGGPSPATPKEELSAEQALAAEELDATDAELLGAVRTILEERDPVPEGLVERVQFALTLDALQAELAAVTEGDLAGARGGQAAVRTVTVAAEGLTVLVTITAQEPGLVRVDGWAVPGSGLTVRLLVGADGPEATADDDGRFAFDRVPVGSARLVLTGPRGTVLTPALEL